MSAWGSNSSTNKFVDTYLRGFLDISGGDISVQNGNIILYNELDSTSTSTGALRVSGGAGIAKNLYVGGTIYGNLIGTIDATISSNEEIIANSVVNSSGTNSGSLQVRGGVGIVKDVYVGGNINILSGTASTSTSTGALQVSGGAGIGGNLFVGGNSSVSGKVGLGIAPSTTYELDVSGQVRIVEVVGSDVSSNLSNGSLTLEHADGSGCSSIMFKGPNTVSNGDYAYIKYQDNESSGLNSGNRGLLTIGIENDVSSNPINNDSISLYAAGGLGYVGVNTKAPTAALDVVGDFKVSGLSSFNDVGIYNATVSATWAQRGLDLSGTANAQTNGISVALSSTETVLAVGANETINTENRCGSVRVYDFSGSTWVQKGQDLSGTEESQHFGNSVALSSSGTVVAVGAPGFVNGLPTCGKVQVYDFSGSLWVQKGQDLSGTAASQITGQSVALSSTGTTVAVGAPGTVNSLVSCGKVQVYDYNGSLWVQKGQDLSGTAASQNTGQSVALSSSGTTVAVGARGTVNGITNCGKVQVYDYNGSLWVQKGQDLSGTAASEYTGNSVALSSSGTTVAVGAPGFLSNAGRVRVYDYNGSIWVQKGQDLSGTAASQFTGNSVALSSNGNMVAIGSNGFLSNVGRVQVYIWTGSAWVQKGVDLLGSEANQNIGESVSLSSTGNVVAVGGTGNVNGFTTRGVVRAYGLDKFSTSSLSINGQAQIFESVGSYASANTGSLVLEHANSSGASSLVFKASNSSSTSDYAYIQYEDNTGFIPAVIRYDLSAAYTTTDLCFNGIPSTGSNTSLIKVGTADASINSVLVSTVGGGIPTRLSTLNPYCLSFNQYNLTSASTARISYTQIQSTVNPFSTAGGFTFAAWIRPTTTISTDCRFYLLNISSGSTTSNFDIYLDGDAGGQISAIIGEDSNNYTRMVVSPTINNWVHYVFTFDNTTSTGLNYRNGVLSHNRVGTGYAGKTLSATNQTILIGSKFGYPTGAQIGSGQRAKGFNGHMTFVNMFDRALTASEIAVLYNTPNYSQTTTERGLMTIGIENEAGSVFNDRIALWPDGGTGRVGVNTKNPANTLDVNGQMRIFETVGSNVTSNVSPASLILEHADGSGCSSIMFKGPNTVSNGDYAYIKYQDNESSGLNSGNRGLLTIGIENDATASTTNDSISLFADGGLGYVGVNTKVPTAALDVVGDLKVSGLSSLKDVGVYNGVISGAWAQRGLDLSGTAASQFAGNSVALSSTGTVIAVGSPGFNSNQGRVQVYNYNGSVWSQLGADLSGTVGSTDKAGYAVALSSTGTIVAVGSPGFNTNAGRIQVYNYNGSVWSQLGSAITGTSVVGYQHGYSLSLSSDGKTILYSSPGASSGANIHIYIYNGSAWVLYLSLLDTSNLLGYSVALSSNGTIFAVGAPGHLTNAGRVQVYEYTSSGYFQRGLDITGSAGYQTGYSVAMSSTGSTIAVGSCYADLSAGRVQVYDWISSSWVKRGIDLSGITAGDQTGWSVALSSSGTTVAFGSNGYLSSAGRVQVYDWNNSSWIQRGFDLSGTAASQLTGSSVALSSSGTVVAVGAGGYSVGATNKGRVQVYGLDKLSISTYGSNFIGINNPNPLYTLDVSGDLKVSGLSNFNDVGIYNATVSATWGQRGLDLSGTINAQQTGFSCALSSTGTVLAVGAPGIVNSITAAGRVRLYDFSGSTWVQKGQDLSGTAANQNTGSSVALSSTGNTVAVGARGTVNTLANCGRVQVYDFSGSLWVQKGQDLSGTAASQFTGNSVSLSSSGTTVAVGAPGFLSNAGKVQVYDYNGSIWVQKGQDLSGTETNQNTGYSVALSSSGTTVAVGAPGFLSNSGRVRVYDFSGSLWVQKGQDLSGTAASELVGNSVALSSTGNTVAVGAPGFLNSAGRVRVYDYNGSLWVQKGQDLSGTAASQITGNSVALSSNGNMVAIGSNGFLSNAGRVQVYIWTGSTWLQKGVDLLGSELTQNIGRSVSLSSAGNVVAVGGTGTVNGGTTRGVVRAYGLDKFSTSSLSVNGQAQIFESVGSYASANTGSLVLEHANSSGASSLVFKASNSSITSDYAYIQYEDNTGFIPAVLRYDLSAAYTTTDLVTTGIPSTGSNTSLIKVGTADASINSVLVSTVGGVGNPRLSALNPFCLSFNQYNLTSASTARISYAQIQSTVNPFSSGFTFSAWIHFKTSAVSNCAFYLLNISSGSATSNLDIYLNIGGQIQIIIGEDTNNYIMGVNTLNNNLWYHLAFTFDNATSKGLIYINGVLIGNTTIGNGFTGKTLGATNQTILLGAKFGYLTGGQIGTTGIFAKGFNGYMTFVNMFDRPLSWTDIAVLYNTPAYSPTTTERGLLTIGIENDATNVFNDRIAVCLGSGHGFVGINTKNPAYSLDVSGNANMTGPLRIVEAVGSNVTSNFSNGSLTLEHADGSGCSSIMFKGSNTDITGDYAYIKYQDNESSGLNSGNRSLLTIGIENDATTSTTNDSISLYAAGGLGYVGVNTKVPAVALDVVGDFKVSGLSNLRDMGINNGSIISNVWTQRGLDLSGTAASQFFGNSVALSSTGTTVAVGSPGFNSNQGRVQVYNYNGSVWSQLGADLSGAPASTNKAGFSVAMSSTGTIVAVGMPGFNSNTGRVLVYNYNGSVWSQLGSVITQTGSAANYQFGYSVSLSSDGNTLAVGIPYFGSPSISSRVHTYTYNGSNWVMQGEISFFYENTLFGWSVALSSTGNTLAVGAPGGLTNTGYASVHDWNGTIWTQRGLNITGSAGYQTGYSVALSSTGSTIAVGSCYADLSAGRVQVYDWISSSWVKRGIDLSGTSPNDQTGWSVALSSTGTTVAVGSQGYATNAGRVQVYDWNNSIWTQRGLDLSGTAASQLTGSSVALSSSGTVVAVGAGGFNANQGRVQVYGLDKLSMSTYGSNFIGINNPNPLYTLDVSGNINASGTVRASGTVLSSDYRIKEFVSPLDQSFNVDILNPVSYYLNGDNSRLQIGFIAHEVQELYPFLVNGVKDGPEIQSINYNGFIGILTKEIQVLKRKDEENRNKIVAQESKIVAQEVRIQRLEEAVAEILKP